LPTTFDNYLLLLLLLLLFHIVKSCNTLKKEMKWNEKERVLVVILIVSRAFCVVVGSLIFSDSFLSFTFRKDFVGNAFNQIHLFAWIYAAPI
jgi:hypothetical protein